MSKSESNPKFEIRNQLHGTAWLLRISDFGFLSDIGFRFSVFALLAFLAAGCTSKKNAKLEAQKAFLAGQQQAMQQYLQTRPNTVRIVGPVQFPVMDWREDLTLVQVIVAAHYSLRGEPRLIVVTRGTEQAQFTARELLQGADIPIESGDIVELRP